MAAMWLALLLTAVACGGGEAQDSRLAGAASGEATPGTTATSDAAGSESDGGDTSGGSAEDPDPSDWEAVLAEADGQTVNWFMYGGDDLLNDYITSYVTDAAAELGVTVNQVRINDTVEAVNTVLGEQAAGRDTDGSVDLIWINGENFSTGKQADLWFCGWADRIPNAELVDWEDPSINTDFGEPVEGCEAPWNRAQSVVVYDSERVDRLASMDDLIAWVEQNPERFTYPAPPDFTGSMVVRTFAYHANGGYEPFQEEFDQAAFEELAQPTWELLNRIEPALWRGGETYPQSQNEVIELFGNGEIDAYITYAKGEVEPNVADGIFPESTRVTVFDEGMIGNTNYVAIPYNSPHKAGAMVLADLLTSAEAQLEKARPDVLGFDPAIDPERTELTDEFAALASELVPPFEELAANSNPEPSAEWLTAIEEGWQANVLQQ
jgi:putative spermidine/putrescine transport system substrate-binding protein